MQVISEVDSMGGLLREVVYQSRNFHPFLSDEAYRNPVICHHWNLVTLTLKAVFFFHAVIKKAWLLFSAIA